MLLLAATLLFAPPPSYSSATVADTGQTVSGVTMPETITVGEHVLALNGMALRKKFIVKVYVAGLYLPAKTSNADEILAADTPRRMVLHFISGHGTKGKMCGAWNDGLEDNTPSASADLKQQFAELCAMMVDIKDGEELLVTYVPGSGSTISIAGTDRGTIQGKDFADAVLRCWIGPKPGPGEGFKKGVLGKAS
jgi:hypothetical protein